MAKGPDNRASIVFDDEEEEVAVSDWSGSTIAIMKEELRRLGMPVSGSHAELVSRLEGLDADDEALDEASDMVADAIADPSESVEEALDRFADLVRPLVERLVLFMDLASKEDAGLGDIAPGTTEQFPTVVGQNAVTREEVRDAARRLLSMQPDGRSRALNILAQYGGSVSAVPDDDLQRCLIALEGELEAVA